jgi:hypothetical protein
MKYKLLIVFSLIVGSVSAQERVLKNPQPNLMQASSTCLPTYVNIQKDVHAGAQPDTPFIVFFILRDTI